MTTQSSQLVDVIIPAHDAEATIAAAVRSALEQPEVSEVIVVDDASRDATAKQAHAAAAGDPRFTLLRQEQNVGPAMSRNIAIAHGSAPLIAILDADDIFLPGRFTPMLTQSDWDIIADNIVFVPDAPLDPNLAQELDHTDQPRVDTLDMAKFLLGNIPRANAYRSELGFLKPVLSRDFLDRQGLRYDPNLRLGEDFILYVEMLAQGARFRVLSHVGYVARVRENSLSGRHSAADLGNLLQASLQLRDEIGRDPASQQEMRAYLRALRGRYLLHAFLELKREHGLSRAMRHALVPPRNFWPIARGVLRDKTAAALRRERNTLATKRYLFRVE